MEFGFFWYGGGGEGLNSVFDNKHLHKVVGVRDGVVIIQALLL